MNADDSTMKIIDLVESRYFDWIDWGFDGDSWYQPDVEYSGNIFMEGVAEPIDLITINKDKGTAEIDFVDGTSKRYSLYDHLTFRYEISEVIK